jgi:hypothetical protein
LGDMSIKTGDDFSTSRLIGTDEFPILFGVELQQPFPLSLQAQCSQGQRHWPFVNLDAKIPPDVHVLIFS